MSFKRLACVVVPLLAVTALLAVHSSSASSATTTQLLQWKTIFGIKESGDVVGVGTPGTGTGAITGGAPWETLGGSAAVDLANGDVNFEVEGLILAVGTNFVSGDSFVTPPASGLPIGTPAGITEVKGTLVCNVSGTGGPSVWVDTPVTTLDAQGNAHFSGSFSSSIPSDCTTDPTTNDAFLIRIGNSGEFEGVWIAFGGVPSVFSIPSHPGGHHHHSH
jgi:hypothetical protein